MNKPRVLLADDNVALAKALAEVLEGECELVGVVYDGRALLNAAQELRPDIIVTDISMPQMSGVEVFRRLKEDGSTAKIIVLTVHQEPQLAAALLRDGVSGYVVKQFAGEELLTALHEVLRGCAYITPLITDKASSHVRSARSRPSPADTGTAIHRNSDSESIAVPERTKDRVTEVSPRHRNRQL
jgi:DNA-binding NarL/FixJ family response regulator